MDSRQGDKGPEHRPHANLDQKRRVLEKRDRFTTPSPLMSLLKMPAPDSLRRALPGKPC